MSLRQEVNWDDDPDADVPSDLDDSSSSQSALGPGTAVDSLKDVARLIGNGSVKNVVIMAGAGISTSAGIPDFRSPDTGLYANLQRFRLPYPEAIFTLSYFKKKPEPFFVLAQDLFPGKHLPTPSHYFFRLLHEKGLLNRVFTQNIDTLETIAGLPADKVVEAHGSFAKSHCLDCKAEAEQDHVMAGARKGEVVRCQRKRCNGLVKPDIVFFGEGLPDRFFERFIQDLPKCDLLIVLGTSLTVHPFASLIARVPDGCPRLLFNRELVGDGVRGGFDFDDGTSDFFYEGDTDAGCRQLAAELGWEGELEDLIATHRAQLRREWSLPASTPAGDDAAATSSSVAERAAEVDEVEDIVTNLRAATIDKEGKEIQAGPSGKSVGSGDSKDAREHL